MIFRPMAVVVTLLLPASAMSYDPDGFHECILDHVKENMDRAATVAIRQACAHLNDTDATGNKKRPPISDNSFVRKVKILKPSISHMADKEVVESVMRDIYADEHYLDVWEWLTRDMDVYGPPPSFSFEKFYRTLDE